MVLDSDGDDPPPDGVPSTADFESNEQCHSEPYDPIIRHLDIPCGTYVRHISTPNIPLHIGDFTPGAFPPILLSNIVVAAACNDNSIRLITLPLLPPLPLIDGASYKSLQTVTIAGTNTHREVPSSIAITHSGITGSLDGREASKSRSRSRNAETEEEGKSTIPHNSSKPWCLLIASISPTAGGLLLTHQIPMISDTQISISPQDLRPIQQCYLESPCYSSKVLFNPSAFPADRHATVLLSTTDAGCVKIHQITSESQANLFRGRRNSTATTDSTNSGLRTPARSDTSSGRFLITLYPNFIRSSNSSSSWRRKRILDVDWVASGRAVVALLEDGEWGVWDLEGVGPGSGSANLIRGQSSMFGIQGGALTKFAFSSRITSPTETFSKTQKPEPRGSEDKRLAPMTPHTRKARSEGLFKGDKPSIVLDNGNAQRSSGHICITERDPSVLSNLSTPEESLIITHDSNIIYVSSLQALWHAETSTKGTFESVDAIRPSHFPGLGLGDQRLIAAADLPRSLQTPKKASLGLRSNELPDLLVVADHQLVLFVSPLPEPIHTEVTENRFHLRVGRTQESALGPVDDQSLLREGQLDLEGMDRVLNGMGHEDRTMNGQNSFGKSVAFDLDDDGDMSMMSPTPKAGSRPNRTPRRLIGRSKGGVVFS
jgi:hypothetical protein